jgi:Leucine-rich repeat (LRR) protein
MLNYNDITDLNLSSANLKCLPEYVSKSKNLKKLSLFNNSLGDQIWDSICSLTSLEHLDLQKCNLSIIPKEIIQLSKLKYLEIGGNKITDQDSLQNLCQLINLERLDFSGDGKNFIIDLPKEFANLKSLKTLELANHHLSEKSIALIKQFACLEDLDIWNF